MYVYVYVCMYVCMYVCIYTHRLLSSSFLGLLERILNIHRKKATMEPMGTPIRVYGLAYEGFGAQRPYHVRLWGS